MKRVRDFLEMQIEKTKQCKAHNLTLDAVSWKEILERKQIFGRQEVEKLLIKNLDDELSYLLDDDAMFLLKKMKVLDDVVEKTYIPKYPLSFSGYEMQKIANETISLPRNDFKGTIPFLDYFDIYNNLKKDSLKYWINKFWETKGVIENDGLLILYSYENGKNFYVFDEGGTHRTYVSILLSPCLNKYTTQFQLISIKKGKDFNKALNILLEYSKLKDYYKEKGLNIKVYPERLFFNAIVYDDENDKCLFLNFNTDNFNQVVEILKREINSLRLSLKSQSLLRKKNILAKVLGFLLSPSNHYNHKYNYRLSICEKKYYLGRNYV